MAPEQVRGEALDERCDLFALGLVAWELLQLEALFDGPTDAAIMHQALYKEIPPPSSVRPELEHFWDAFVARALDRSLGGRFQTAQEMGHALQPALDSATRPLAARRRTSPYSSWTR